MTGGRPIVLHLNDAYLPLTETWIYNQVRKLRRWEPVFAARQLKNLDLFPLARVHRVGRGGRWESRLDTLVFRATGRPLVSPRRLAREVRPALLHAHFGNEGVRALPLRKSLGVPLVTTFYGADVSMLPRQPFWRRQYKRLFAQGDLFLVEGPHMGERLVDLGCPREKVQLQHLGADLGAILYPVDREGRETFTVLVVASFREKKGIPDAVEAFAKAFGDDPRARLRILGDGPLRPVIEARVAALGLGERATLLGYQPQKVMFEEMAGADVLIQPSVVAPNGDTEGGAPVCTIEAQACGLPVVGTTHADIPEVVQHEVTGLLAPERDVETLARHLKRLRDEPALRREMGRRGRERMEREFDLDVQARRLEAAYDRARDLAR